MAVRRVHLWLTPLPARQRWAGDRHHFPTSNGATMAAAPAMTSLLRERRRPIRTQTVYNRLMISKPSLQRWLRLDGVTEGAPRLEFEQALVRVFISATVLACVEWYVARDGVITGKGTQALVASFAFFAFAVTTTVRILQAPGISKTRRILGIVIDNAVATYALVVLGEGGAVILCAYLFITFGNGFRYGRFYLHLSQTLSVTGFSFVMLISSFWSQHLEVGLGFLITLLLIPFDVGVLVARIAPRQRTDDASQANVKAR